MPNSLVEIDPLVIEEKSKLGRFTEESRQMMEKFIVRKAYLMFQFN